MLLLLPLLGLQLFALTQATFFGPVAVGFGVGLVGLRRKFPVATSIVSRRSSRQYSLSSFYQSSPHATFGYATRSYSVANHYYTPNNRYYYQPNLYHYHSTPWARRFTYGRKKRSAENAERRRVERQAGSAFPNLSIDEISVNKISDVAANASAGFNDKIWYNDMSFKDRDDCAKRLLCDLNSKLADGEPMEEDEIMIAQSFGLDDAVDVGEETMGFDIASIVGKQIGAYMCERRYRRCTTPTSTMMEMIRKEVGDLEVVEEEIKSGKSTLQDIDNALADEAEEISEISESDLTATTTTTTTTTTAPYFPVQRQIWGAATLD